MAAPDMRLLLPPPSLLIIRPSIAVIIPLHHHHTLNPFGFYIQLLSCEPGMHLLPFKSHRLPPDLRALPSPSSRIKCGSEMNLTHAVVP